MDKGCAPRTRATPNRTPAATPQTASLTVEEELPSVEARERLVTRRHVRVAPLLKCRQPFQLVQKSAKPTDIGRRTRLAGVPKVYESTFTRH